LSGVLGPGRLAIVASMVAAGIALLAIPASAGSLYQGCDEAAGTMFMDGAPGEVEHFVAGYKPSTGELHAEGTRNGSIFSAITCKSKNWKQFTSYLRDKSDRIRADGVGITAGTGFGPLPKTIKAVIKGDGGNDTLIGHPGPDNINAGAGTDTVKALAGDDVVNTADGVADTVDCGLGNDKAVVDNKDDLTSCEVVTVSP
jgi:Ca2+-binding RTX toxin-like protein